MVTVANKSVAKDVAAAVKNPNGVLPNMCNAKSVRAASKPPADEKNFVKTESALGSVFVEKKADEKLVNGALYAFNLI